MITKCKECGKLFERPAGVYGYSVCDECRVKKWYAEPMADMAKQKNLPLVRGIRWGHDGKPTLIIVGEGTRAKKSVGLKCALGFHKWIKFSSSDNIDGKKPKQKMICGRCKKMKIQTKD